MGMEPAAPAAPVEPAAPVAPVEPPTPAPTPPAPVDGEQPTADQKADEDEWDAALKDFEEEGVFPGLKSTNTDKGDDKNEPAKPGEKPKENEAGADDKTPKDPAEAAKDKTDDGTTDTGDGTDDENEQASPDEAIARRTAREQQDALDVVKTDVRAKMFADQPTKLVAGDGEVLDSAEKVMQYNNPATGEPFTREEATLWLSSAERELSKRVEDINSQVDQIADVNLDLKDQADIVNYGYGELLRAMPDLRAKLWGEYEKSLTKDAKSGIITKAPLSLQNFYEAALEPYAELGRRLETQDVTQTADQKAVADKAIADAEAAKAQRRADRSDIYQGGKVDTQTEESKEWGNAALGAFGEDVLRGAGLIK